MLGGGLSSMGREGVVGNERGEDAEDDDRGDKAEGEVFHGLSGNVPGKTPVRGPEVSRVSLFFREKVVLPV